jgi:hypothetical protein
MYYYIQIGEHSIRTYRDYHEVYDDYLNETDCHSFKEYLNLASFTAAYQIALF